MENILQNHGIDAETMRADIQRSLDQSKGVYWQRMAGMTWLWSATTRCVKCGAWWMWGVKDNLNFVCDKCREAK